MQRNRSINGAENPGDVAKSDAAAQREQRKLMTNDTDLGSPQSRTFEPDLETLEAINRRHREVNVSGDEEGPTYEQHVPYGPLMGVHPDTDLQR